MYSLLLYITYVRLFRKTTYVLSPSVDNDYTEASKSLKFSHYMREKDGIPYTGHRAQITPSPPLFFFSFFSCFYAYFRLGLVKFGLGLPRRVRKEV